MSALSAAKTTLSVEVLSKPIREAINLTAADSRRMAAFIVSLHAQRERQREWAKAGVEDFVEAVCEELAEIQAEGFDLSAFRHGLRGLMELDEPVGASAKAIDIVYEHERLLQSARIITDLRPVFGRNPEDGPRAAVLLHTLRLEYFDTGGQRSRSFGVLMDKEDIEVLQGVLERALKKGNAMKQAWGKTGLAVLEPESES